MNGQKGRELAISVGGSKCAFGIVGGTPPAVLARSGRIEWTGEGIKTIESFVGMLARETQKLLKQAGISAADIGRVGVAWPGPGTDGQFEATFIPSCEEPQPIPLLLRSTLTIPFGPAFGAIPIRVMLDAVARAAGEAGPSGALHTTANGLLVNLATGIAGGRVRQGRAWLAYPGIGENYGQFGRFLFFNTVTQEWDWRPTSDGSVPSHSPREVRWTHLCAGPALARRIVRWCHETGVDARNQTPAVEEALRHYESQSAPRDGTHEMTLLRWATAESVQCPQGSMAHFVRQVAREIGAALRVLLRVFASEGIDTIALAGGVGEHFGRSDNPGNDMFLNDVQLTMEQNRTRVCRARLGVDAEFLGLASNSFIAAP